jgi:transcriptional regulator
MLYQPAHRKFEVADTALLLAELCRVIPATLVTSDADGFRTSILPMLFDQADGDHGTLRGHLARGNHHWRVLEHATAALAIFHGPEAYISPSWYAEKRRSGKVVPTWNYVTVQAEGAVSVVHEAEWLLRNVGQLVERHEGARPEPWELDDAPPDYVTAQARAIVGVELRINRIEGKQKLSQNRATDDIDGAVAGLSEGTPAERAVAAAMRDEAAVNPRR